jgi:predicted nuclease of restriction endonuclease-like (RecB) superfamily
VRSQISERSILFVEIYIAWNRIDPILRMIFHIFLFRVKTDALQDNRLSVSGVGINVAKNLPIVGKGYDEFLRNLKERIRIAQVKAALAVNRELVLLYWQIGREILARQKSEGWGAKVVGQLAKDLKAEFPDMTGLSRTNLLYMRAFAEAYSDESIVQQVVGQIPWGHNVRILDAVKDPEQRIWYIQQTIANGWSRNVLVLQIESRLFERQGNAITNFEQALPKPQSDLAQQLLKDPYNFEFLTISQNAQELELERALVTHIRDFLLELGMGFSFVGSRTPWKSMARSIGSISSSITFNSGASS